MSAVELFSPDLPLFPSDPSPSLRICVVVPARDEAPRLAATLDALFAQINAPPFEVLLLCNGCADDTVGVAQRWKEAHAGFPLHIAEITLPAQCANIGTARRLLMDAACARLDTTLPNGAGIIASTDADTRPHEDWLHTLDRAIQNGADAVGSRILAAPPDAAEARSAARHLYLRDTSYRLLIAQLEDLLDPVTGDARPRHFQFFGAGLGMTVCAYQEIGGLPLVSCLEDVMLKRALQCRDLTIRHAPESRVVTLARRDGRVQTGLSTQLQEWQDLARDNKEWVVPSAREIAAEFRMRRALREAWQERPSLSECAELWQQIHSLECWAEEMGLVLPVVSETLIGSPYFGAAWQDVLSARDQAGYWRAQFPPVPVTQALRELRCLLRSASV